MKKVENGSATDVRFETFEQRTVVQSLRHKRRIWIVGFLDHAYLVVTLTLAGDNSCESLINAQSPFASHSPRIQLQLHEELLLFFFVTPHKRLTSQSLFRCPLLKSLV